MDTYLVASIYVRDASDADATVILKIKDSDCTDLATTALHDSREIQHIKKVKKEWGF